MKTYSFKGYLAITIIIILVFSTSGHAIAQESFKMKKGVIYVVRHAEKDTGNDPRLSAWGYIRSGELGRELKSKRLNRIYVTQFRRTRLTADSVRLNQKVDTVHYVADNNGDGLINALLKNKNKEKRILIIGHSNTIPVILRRLGINDYPAGNIPDNEYDNLYRVTFHKGKTSLFKSKYGKSSVPGSNQGSLKMLQ